SVNTPTLGQVDSVNEVTQNVSSNYFTELAHNWLEVRNRFPFMHGVCVPSICTSAQLERLIQKCKEKFGSLLKLVITCNQNLDFKKYLNGMKIEVDYCQDDTLEMPNNFGFQVAM